jgi:zinc/manganese transport system permease protein
MDSVQLQILLPAFVAGLLVIATHVPLGREVLTRGIIFIDLAVAQIAGLGVLSAHLIGFEHDAWLEQVVAFLAALTGAVLLYHCEKRWPEIQEALIGSVFVLAATASVLLLANNPHGAEHLKDLLVGQILWVEYDQLVPVALLYTFILLVWFITPLRRHPATFYIVFALSITASVQLVGVYLVFASLILPALAIRHFHRSAVPLGYLIGILGYAAGLWLAALFDWPAGAVIVWALAIIALLVNLLFCSAPPVCLKNK